MSYLPDTLRSDNQPTILFGTKQALEYRTRRSKSKGENLESMRARYGPRIAMFMGTLMDVIHGAQIGRIPESGEGSSAINTSNEFLYYILEELEDYFKSLQMTDPLEQAFRAYDAFLQYCHRTTGEIDRKANELIKSIAAEQLDTKGGINIVSIAQIALSPSRAQKKAANTADISFAAPRSGGENVEAVLDVLTKFPATPSVGIVPSARLDGLSFAFEANDTKAAEFSNAMRRLASAGEMWGSRPMYSIFDDNAKGYTRTSDAIFYLPDQSGTPEQQQKLLDELYRKDVAVVIDFIARAYSEKRSDVQMFLQELKTVSPIGRAEFRSTAERLKYKAKREKKLLQDIEFSQIALRHFLMLCLLKKAKSDSNFKTAHPELSGLESDDKQVAAQSFDTISHGLRIFGLKPLYLRIKTNFVQSHGTRSGLNTEAFLHLREHHEDNTRVEVMKPIEKNLDQMLAMMFIRWSLGDALSAGELRIANESRSGYRQSLKEFKRSIAEYTSNMSSIEKMEEPDFIELCSKLSNLLSNLRGWQNYQGGKDFGVKLLESGLKDRARSDIAEAIRLLTEPRTQQTPASRIAHLEEITKYRAITAILRKEFPLYFDLLDRFDARRLKAKKTTEKSRYQEQMSRLLKVMETLFNSSLGSKVEQRRLQLLAE